MADEDVKIRIETEDATKAGTDSAARSVHDVTQAVEKDTAAIKEHTKAVKEDAQATEGATQAKKRKKKAHDEGAAATDKSAQASKGEAKAQDEEAKATEGATQAKKRKTKAHHEHAEAAGKSKTATDGVTNAHHQHGKAAHDSRMALMDLQMGLQQAAMQMGVLSAATLYAGKLSIDAYNEMRGAFMGLEGVATRTGQSINDVKQAAQSLAEDGLLTVVEASKAVQSGLATGFDLGQTIDLINAFKDSASFNRQSGLEFGEAVTRAMEGVRMGNSVLADAAGITKNLSVILREAGKSEQDLQRVSSDAAVRRALYNGLIKESGLFEGNAAKMADELAGAQARVAAEVKAAAAEVGEALAPAIAGLLDSIKPTVAGFREWTEENPELVRTMGLVSVGATTTAAAITGLSAALVGLIGLMGPAGLIILGASAATGAVAGFASSIAANGEAAADNREKLSELVREYEDLRAKVQDTSTEEDERKRVLGELQKVLQDIQTINPDLVDGYNLQRDALERYNVKLDEAVEKHERLKTALLWLVNNTGLGGIVETITGKTTPERRANALEEAIREQVAAQNRLAAIEAQAEERRRAVRSGREGLVADPSLPQKAANERGLLTREQADQLNARELDVINNAFADEIKEAEDAFLKRRAEVQRLQAILYPGANQDDGPTTTRRLRSTGDWFTSGAGSGNVTQTSTIDPDTVKKRFQRELSGIMHQSVMEDWDQKAPEKLQSALKGLGEKWADWLASDDNWDIAQALEEKLKGSGDRLDAWLKARHEETFRSMLTLTEDTRKKGMAGLAQDAADLQKQIITAEAQVARLRAEGGETFEAEGKVQELRRQMENLFLPVLDKERAMLESLLLDQTLTAEQRKQVEERLLAVKDQIRTVDLNNHRLAEEAITAATERSAELRAEAEREAAETRKEIQAGLMDALKRAEEEALTAHKAAADAKEQALSKEIALAEERLEQFDREIVAEDRLLKLTELRNRVDELRDQQARGMGIGRMVLKADGTQEWRVEGLEEAEKQLAEAERENERAEQRIALQDEVTNLRDRLQALQQSNREREAEIRSNFATMREITETGFELMDEAQGEGFNLMLQTLQTSLGGMLSEWENYRDEVVRLINSIPDVPSPSNGGDSTSASTGATPTGSVVTSTGITSGHLRAFASGASLPGGNPFTAVVNDVPEYYTPAQHIPALASHILGSMQALLPRLTMPTMPSFAGAGGYGGGVTVQNLNVSLPGVTNAQQFAQELSQLDLNAAMTRYRQGSAIGRTRG